MHSDSIFRWLAGVLYVIGLDAMAPMLGAQESSTAIVEQRPSLSGKVVYPISNDNRNAVVYLLRQPDRGFMTLPALPETVKSYQGGGFAFKDLSPGRYLLWAEMGEATSLSKVLGGRSIWVSRWTNSIQPVELSMHRGSSYVFRIVDDRTGKPIANAIVRCSFDINRISTSDENGFAVFEGLPPHRQSSFNFSADSYASENRKFSIQNLGSRCEVDIRLRPGGSVIGVVKDTNGLPIENASVGFRIDSSIYQDPVAMVKTDVHGRYTLSGLPFGKTLEVHAGKIGFVSTSKDVFLWPQMEPLTMDTSLYVEANCGNCSVHVEAEDGMPIKGARVYNTGVMFGVFREAFTDAQGNCELTNLFTNSRYPVVKVEAAGFLPKSLDLPKLEMPHTSEDVRVVLSRGQRIVGRVVDSRGKPIEKAFVRFHRGETSTAFIDSVFSDPEGNFVIESVPDPCSLEVYAQGYSAIKGLKVDQDSASDLMVELQPEVMAEAQAKIIVRAVHSETDEPLDFFTVMLDQPMEGIQGNAPGISIQDRVDGRTICDGRDGFRIESIAEGTSYRLSIVAPGFEKEIVPLAAASLDENEASIVVRLRPIDPHSRRVASGTVVMANQDRIANARVRLIVANDKAWREIDRKRSWSLLSGDLLQTIPGVGQVMDTWTNERGEFRFENVVHGESME